MEDKDYKACSECSQLKSVQDFYFLKCRNRYHNICKSCYSFKRKPITKRYLNKNRESINEKLRAYQKKNNHKRNAYYHNNREKMMANNKASYEKYRELNIEKRKVWYQNNKEKHAENRTKYELENKDRLRAARRKWENERLLNDANYKLHKSIAKRIRYELKGIGKKDNGTEDIIGCTIEELKVFVENQFKEDMSWDNWNTNGWHLDHRIPVSWFNLENINCLKLAFNYKNLQPLWSEDNLEKKNFYSHKMAV